MEHPFLSATEISESATIEELQAKISGLLSRLQFAYSTGNLMLINQLQMALESYNAALKMKLDELMPKDNSLSDKIDIK